MRAGNAVVAAESDPEQPIVPAATKKFLQRHSPVHASTYVENIAGQVRSFVMSACRLWL
jgi:hypothetical protein